MASDEAKEIYKQRAATAECVNAQARNRGLLRMPVRGLAKVRSVVGLFVLAHNLMRMAVLAPQLIGWGTGPSAMDRAGRMRGQEMTPKHSASPRIGNPAPITGIVLRNSTPREGDHVEHAAAVAPVSTTEKLTASELRTLQVHCAAWKPHVCKSAVWSARQ